VSGFKKKLTRNFRAAVTTHPTTTTYPPTFEHEFANSPLKSVRPQQINGVSSSLHASQIPTFAGLPDEIFAEDDP
jgi:hypothetical protein